MPLIDFLYRCPLCGHDPMEGEGDVATCPGCGRVFRRGGEGGLIRVEAPQGAAEARPGHELGALLTPSHPSLPYPPEGHTLRTPVTVREASGERSVRRRREILGFREDFGASEEGILQLGRDALILWPVGEEGKASPPTDQWSLLDIRAIQTSSRSLQISPGTGGVVQFRFPRDSVRRWEDQLHRHLRELYRKRGRGEILEFQPRIVTDQGERGSRTGASQGPWVPENAGMRDGAEGNPKGYGGNWERASSAGLGWYGFFRAMMQFMLRLHGRVEVRGREHIPKRGPFILVANHQSNLDPILTQSACPRAVHTLTKSTQFGVPGFGWLLMRVNGIPTRRYSVDPQVVRVVLRRLSQGEAVGIYPEGERSWDGTLQPFRRGTLRLLLRVGVPIIPCGISGAYDIMPRWSRRVLRKKVRVAFGEPMVWPVLETRREREAAVAWAEETLVNRLKALGAWVS